MCVFIKNIYKYLHIHIHMEGECIYEGAVNQHMRWHPMSASGIAKSIGMSLYLDFNSILILKNSWVNSGPCSIAWWWPQRPSILSLAKVILYYSFLTSCWSILNYQNVTEHGSTESFCLGMYYGLLHSVCVSNMLLCMFVGWNVNSMFAWKNTLWQMEGGMH